MNFKVVIKANKSRDKKEKVISHYMDDDNYKNKLIMEFISIKEKYGSNEQLSFIPGRLLDFIQYMIYDYNIREFKTNAVDGLAQNTQDANGQAIVVVPRDIIKPIAQYISANDA